MRSWAVRPSGRSHPSTPLSRPLLAFHTASLRLAPPPPSLLALRSLDSDADHARAEQWLDGFKVDDIPKDTMEITYSRSSGPGGQHVNKTNSKASVRVTLGTWLPPFILPPLSKSPHYIPSPPSLLVSSQFSRTASSNLSSALSIAHQSIVLAGRGIIRGQTSEEQRQRVAGLVRAEEKRRREGKDRAKAKKANRRKDWD